MHKGVTVTLGLTALIIGGFAFAFLHLSLLDSLWLCGEQTVVEKPSPDGRYVAVLMRRKCRVTDPPLTHINIRLASSPPFPNHFVGGPINEGEVFGTFKFSGERFCWSSPRKLEIDSPGGENLPGGAWADVTVGWDYNSCR